MTPPLDIILRGVRNDAEARRMTDIAIAFDPSRPLGFAGLECRLFHDGDAYGTIRTKTAIVVRRCAK